MAEVERRRQLRRQRILENSESRREKIFGITRLKADDNNEEISDSFATSTPNAPEGKVINSSEEPVNVCKTPVSTRFETKKNSINTEVHVKNIDVSDEQKAHELVGNLMNQNFLNDRENSTFASSFNLNAVPTIETNTSTSRNPFVPILLAILVCFFLSMGYNEVVFGSLALPIVLYELHYVVYSLYYSDNKEASLSGLLGASLLLCGIKQSVVSQFIGVVTSLKSVSGDFSLYFVTVVLWDHAIGLEFNEQKRNIP